MPAAAVVVVAKSRFPFLTLAAALMLAVATMMGTARAGSVAELDRDNGLPDAQLGTPLKNMPGLKQTEDTGRWLSYTRPTDQLKYGGREVKSITYNFFKEKLYSIFLEVEGGRNVKDILKTLQKQYGKETSYELHTYAKTATQVEIREWAGTKVYCVYKEGTDFRGGILTFLDKPTWDLLQVPKREKEAQTREMLKGSFTNGDF